MLPSLRKTGKANDRRLTLPDQSQMSKTRLSESHAGTGDKVTLEQEIDYVIMVRKYSDS